MVIIHTHAKGQGQRSVGLKDKVATDRRTNRRMDGRMIISRANAVCNKAHQHRDHVRSRHAYE